jgi:hypothetical protein
MVATDFVFAIVITLVVTVLFAYFFRRGGSWAWVALFFFALFFGTWAVGAWLPFGPRLWGSAWLAYLAAAVVLGMIFASAMPRRPAEPPLPGSGNDESRPRDRAYDAAADASGSGVEKERTALAVTASMLLFIGGMVIGLLAIVAHYATQDGAAPAHSVERAADTSSETVTR